MAQALVAGGCASGVIDASQVGSVDPNPTQGAYFDNSFLNAKDGMEWLAGASDGQLVVLAIKPQMLADAIGPVRDSLAGSKACPVVVSILAGTRAGRVHESIGGYGHVVRAMPNTPAAISMGMSAIARGPSATDEDMELARKLLSGVGGVVEIEESMMDAFTGLAGSGPAYVFYLAEGMVKAALEMGFELEQAQRIVAQTIAGSGMLLASSMDAPERLRARVTSKGGTTAAGTGALDDHGVMAAITAAVLAARDRGIELGRD